MAHLFDLMNLVILKVMLDDTLTTCDNNPVVESPHEVVTFLPQGKHKVQVMRGLSNLCSWDETLPTKDLKGPERFTRYEFWGSQGIEPEDIHSRLDLIQRFNAWVRVLIDSIDMDGVIHPKKYSVGILSYTLDFQV